MGTVHTRAVDMMQVLHVVAVRMSLMVRVMVVERMRVMREVWSGRMRMVVLSVVGVGQFDQAAFALVRGD